MGEEGDAEGTYAALCVEFTLPPSTYATMLLRELLKRSVTVDDMKKLNEGGKEDDEEEKEGIMVVDE